MNYIVVTSINTSIYAKPQFAVPKFLSSIDRMHMNAFYLFSLVHLLLYERSCSDFFSPSVSSPVTGSPLGTTATPVSSNSREASETCSLPPLASPGVPEQSLITSAKCRTSCLNNVSLVQCQTFSPSFACVRVCVCACACACVCVCVCV